MTLVIATNKLPLKKQNNMAYNKKIIFVYIYKCIN